mgnify:CR=1 FL=1
MLKMFNYKKSENALFNDVVDGIVDSARQHIEGVQNRKEYEEMQSDVCENLVKYCVSGTRYEDRFEAEGLDLVKNPSVNGNRDFRENFDAVIAQVINATLPMTMSSRFADTFMEIHHIGWGDTARFIVDSNELYQVNELAEGIHRGALQPIYNNEIVVNPQPVEIAVSIDWYLLASRKFDIGVWAAKIARSFENYVLAKAIAALIGATDGLGAGYVANGVDVNNYGTLAQRVSAVNGGSAIYALGTSVALSKLVPSTVGLQYGLGVEITKNGFLDRYLGTNVIAIDQAIDPLTINSSAKLMVPDDKIFLVSANAYKPLKICMEGNEITLTDLPEYTSDRTYTFSVKVRLGIAAILGSKHGVINL